MKPMAKPPISFGIRVANPGDAHDVSRLLNASYMTLMPAAYDFECLSAALPVMTKANLRLLHSGTYYIAHERDKDELIGCGGWTIEEPGTGVVMRGRAHIRHFATHPEYTGKGIGRAIFDRCIMGARHAGATGLDCYSSLNARSFYEALGFELIEPKTIAMPGNVSFPSLHMRRQL
jgi:GNAT superfamily N-acetyltransferase